MNDSKRRRCLLGLLMLWSLWLMPGWVLAQGPRYGQSDTSAAILTLPSGPGSLQGFGGEATLNVFSGQVAYTIPIELPAGVAGMSPQLGLTYHGALGNGPLGVGWSLAVPSIVRSQRRGVPTFSPDDEIELQQQGAGGRLVAVGADDFRVEGHGQKIRVRRQGAGWLLQDGRGITHLFGNTAGSRQEAAGRVTAWLLQSSRDMAGNEIRYTYTFDRGASYLTGITWGPKQRFKVSLVYAPRPDVTSGFRSGLEVHTAQRLERIDVMTARARLRTYTLQYENRRALSHLAGVHMFGHDGATAMPPITFGYVEPKAAAFFELGNHGNWRLGERGTILADYDGDGMGDLLQLDTGQVRRNLGGAFADPVQTQDQWAADLPETRVLDLDRDGHLELLREGMGEGWHVSRLKGHIWQADTNLWPGSEDIHLSGPSVALVDVNGDGYVDSLYGWMYGMRLAFGGPQGLRPVVRVDALDSALAHLSSDSARFVDLNGDGLIDAIGLGSMRARVFLGRGDGTFADQGAFRYPFENINLDPTDMHIADLDRDGLADLIITRHGHVDWCLGAAAGGFSQQCHHLSPPTPLSSEVALADINGNGSTDLVWDSGWAADIAGDTSAGMLASIDNGMGKRTEFHYRPSAQLRIEDEAHDIDWAHAAPVSVPVCVRMEEVATNTGNLLSASSYAPRDAAWDHQENQFAGFLAVVQTEHADAAGSILAESTRFHPGMGDERVLRGKVVAKTLHTDTTESAPLRVETQQWTALRLAALSQVANPLARLPVQSQVTTDIYEGEANPVRLMATSVYDQEGNLTQVRDEGRLDQPGDERLRTYAYASNDADWIRGVVTEQRDLDGDSTVLRHHKYYYDGGRNAPLPWGEVGAGRSTKTEGWLQSADRWLTLASTAYDSVGNPTDLFADGLTREIRYDASGLYPIEETLIPAPGRTLRWQMDWDPRLGQPRRLTSPSGSVERVEYDALGRVSALGQGDQPAHTTFTYLWAQPLPMTLTHQADGPAGDRVHVAVRDGAGRALLNAWQLTGSEWQVDGFRTYDQRGNLTRQTVPYLAAGVPDSAPAAVAERVSTFDALGRLRETHLPTGSVRRMTYAPLKEVVTETDLGPVAYALDGQAQLVAVERTVAGNIERTRARYDGLGQLTGIDFQDAAATQRFAYDSLGRLTVSESPDWGQRRYRYNDRGWLVQQTNGAGQDAFFTYDRIGRVTSRYDAQSRYHYHYDLAADGSSRGMGRLVSVEEPHGEVQIAYDARGQIAETRRRIEAATAWKRFDYTPTGLLQSTRTDDNLALTYAYDGAGRLNGIGDLWHASALSAAGATLAEELGNGLRVRTQRDALDLATAVQIQQGAETLYAASASYTGFGALAHLNERDAAAASSNRFHYDEAARLTHAEVGPFSFDYAYDALQDMLQRDYRGPSPLPLQAGEQAHEQAGRPRQLSRAGDLAVRYDGAGRMRQVGNKTASYDAFDRLTDVRLGPSRNASFGYGFDGERVLRRSPAGETLFFSAETSETGGIRRHRINVGERTVAWVETEAGQVVRTTTLLPGIETHARLVADPSGRITERRQYEPFGVSLTGVAPADAHGQTNKFTDPATGWVDHGARWMVPELGQWSAPDPQVQFPNAALLRQPWGLHPYQFGNQNPKLYEDPDGRALNFAAAGLGFLTGGVVGGSVEAGRQMVMGEALSARAISAASAGGAASGALAGLTCGASLMLEVGGVAGGTLVGTVATNAINHQVSTVQSVMTDTAISLATLGMMRSASTVFRSVRSDLMAGVKTPEGLAKQGKLLQHHELLESLHDGQLIYRKGEFGRQRVIDGQYWSFKHPITTKGYAQLTGMKDGRKMDWVMGARIRPGSKPITRVSPAQGNNPGGDVEAVLLPQDRDLSFFHMP